MIRIACLAFVLLMSLPGASCAEGLLAIIAKGPRQEKLYYDQNHLPDPIAQLIEGSDSVRDYQDAYRGTDDEIVKFNLVLIMDKKLLRGMWTGADKDAALDFLRKCVRNANPWIKTEAVYALGNSGDRTALADVRKCLEDGSLTAVYHALVAYRQLAGEQPELSPAQVKKVEAFLHVILDSEARNALADRELADYVKQAAF